MRYGTALLLIAGGAIAAYAVTWTPSFIDLQTAGAIVMLVGVLGLAVSLAVDLAPHRAARRRSQAAVPPPTPRSPEQPWPVIQPHRPRPQDPRDQPTRRIPRD